MVGDLKITTMSMERFLPEDSWFRSNPRGIHGTPHTTRVLIWANELIATISGPGALRDEELRWAAAVHDVGRINDGIDPGHGARSATWVRDHLVTERPATATLDLAVIAELCSWHETPDREIEQLSLELLILKDADALDRCRISDLDPARLRLARSHDLIEPAARLERLTNDYGNVTSSDVLHAAPEF
jgi:uncharacterized protein